MATDRLINSTQGDSIIGKLDDIKTAINNQSTAATATPLMDGAAAVGTSTKYARENHVHPTDTSRAANVMSTYAIDTARENITNSSTVQSAIEQLEYREETNKNNISYNTNNGVKNVYDYANSDLAYKASSCTATKSANGISVSSSGTWAFASYPMTLKSGVYKLVCTITDLVIEDEQVRITIGTNAQATGEALTTFGVSSNGKKISGDFTLQTDSTVYLILYINQSAQYRVNRMLVSNIMIIPSNIDDTSYQPYALSNAELTAAIQTLQAQLANQ